MRGSRSHALIREGPLAGILGATSVAVWFLILDTLQGQPLHTPAILGGATLSILGPPFDDSTLTRVAVYTVVHYAAFIAIGTLAVALVHRSRNEPSILAGLLIMFVAFQIGFYALVSVLLDPAVHTTLGWPQVAVGNVLAALAMGTYIWRTHPMLGHDFAHALSGEE
jgi:4-amino-4-deoxy-L-arabinose transferase-like glycosyltransferase